jgi:hypothetical protein
MTKQAEREATLLAFVLMDHRRAQTAELNELRQMRDMMKEQIMQRKMWDKIAEG